jgi:hypothetical protein
MLELVEHPGVVQALVELATGGSQTVGEGALCPYALQVTGLAELAQPWHSCDVVYTCREVSMVKT